MAPKVAGAIAKAAAKAKAAVKAKAKAKAKAAGGLGGGVAAGIGGAVAAAGGGAVAPGVVVHSVVGSAGPAGVTMAIFDALGDTTFNMSCAAVSEAFGVAPVTLSHPDIQFTVTPPAPAGGGLPLGGKGVGKGVGPWNPNGTWDIILNAALDPPGVRPTQLEVRMAQDAVQWLVD